VPVLVVEDSRLTLHDPFGGAVRPAQGLVGLDVLARFRVTLDPQRGSVVFGPRRGLPETESAPCLRVEAFLLVPVRAEGRTLWFALDTGASHSSLTEQGLLELPGGARRAVDAHRRVRSPGGSRFAVRLVPGLTLELSEVRFRAVDLPVVARRAPAVFPLHGVLGSDLLLRCRTTIDGGRVRVEAL
jgi:hypothetical protein